eukprot:3174069-Amphidinium_carterae.1
MTVAQNAQMRRSNITSTKHPLALRTNTRPLHLCELGNCQGAPVAALDFDAYGLGSEVHRHGHAYDVLVVRAAEPPPPRTFQSRSGNT